MNQFVLECERMKYKDFGIYHYCLNLGNHLKNALNDKEEKLTFYAPANAQAAFGENQFITQHSFHKFLLPSLDKYDLWHATYQLTNYMPERNKRIKVLLTIHDLNFIHDDNKS